MEKEIGRGGFSTVTLATHKRTGLRYAIKIINKSILTPRAMKCLEREIEILKKVNHPNIIQLHEIIDTPSDIFIVLE